MSSDAFAELRAWLQGTASTSTEESFLTASPAHRQEPHDRADAPKGDEDLEGLFANFNWDLSSHALPEPLSFEDLSQKDATIGINPMDTLLQPQPCSVQAHTPTHGHGQFVEYPLSQAEHPSAVPSAFAPYGALSSAIGPWAAPLDPYQAYYESWLYRWYTTSPPRVALHSVTSDPTPGLQHAGQVIGNTHYTNGGNSDDVIDAPTPRARRKMARSGTRKNAIRLFVARRSKLRKPTSYNYECGHCDAWFTRIYDRQRHMQTGCAKGEQKEWQCPLCFKMYSRIDSRARHCQSLHNMSYNDACVLRNGAMIPSYKSSEAREEPIDMTVGMNMNRYRTINAEEMYDDRDRVGSKGTNAQDYDYGMWAYIRPQRMIYHLSRELEKTVHIGTPKSIGRGTTIDSVAFRVIDTDDVITGIDGLETCASQVLVCRCLAESRHQSLRVIHECFGKLFSTSQLLLIEPVFRATGAVYSVTCRCSEGEHLSCGPPAATQIAFVKYHSLEASSLVSWFIASSHVTGTLRYIARECMVDVRCLLWTEEQYNLLRLGSLPSDDSLFGNVAEIRVLRYPPGLWLTGTSATTSVAKVADQPCVPTGQWGKIAPHDGRRFIGQAYAGRAP
ncbi:hypothetical protein IEO21_09631 [Rhodonia placenta]|uniref:C2H2-type domain-containing protein n=1 Tax=Rhodonia placenta TaxID=104341 RepID=A0A8H7TY86_9APHY|nr:hypothetical protein IEO21_09631 [Postia placenta]